jgi:3-oxoacyl-[acyl-carrier protein] reductase
MTGSALRGRVAIVTGATSGIGSAIASALVRERASVVASGRDGDRLRVMVDSLRSDAVSADVIGVRADIIREEEVQLIADAAVQRWGRIDILVASAGILRGPSQRAKQLVDTHASDWDQVIATNLTGAFLSIRAVLPTMIRQRSGDLVAISSTSARRGLAYDGAYCASKFALMGLSQSLALEAEPYGIRLQVVVPGPVDTPMWHSRDGIPRSSPALSAHRVSDLIVRLLTLPRDAMVPTVTVIPSQPSEWHGA